jgi:8-oxo-dGTP diphosphatase
MGTVADDGSAPGGAPRERPDPPVPSLEGRPPAGETWCVGAVVRDADGRVFVQRRTDARANMPGCWDVVGGHVEPGETFREALAREIDEETGWTLRRVVRVLGVFPWRGSDGVLRSEVDSVVEVDGDLAAPRLAPEEHDRYRWIRPEEIGLLDENAGRDEGLVRAVVEAALTAGTSPPSR